MQRSMTALLVLCLLALSTSRSAWSAVEPSVRDRIGALSVPFVPNAGQWDSEAAFAAHTFAGTLFVTTSGKLVYRLAGKRASRTEMSRSGRGALTVHSTAAGPGWVLTETLVDSGRRAIPVTPAGHRVHEGRISYAIGKDESKHRDELSGYERIDLGDVYPGINVQLRATGVTVEKIFTVAPMRDPGSIRLSLDGAQRLEVGSRGELIAYTGHGPVTYTAPIAYQEAAADKRESVDVRYALDTSNRSYGFTLGAYDRTRPLVIDPLLQSTYLGGNNDDLIVGIAIHPATGEVYVAGLTASSDFPKVAGAEQTMHSETPGDSDGFVARLNAALTTRLQSTYLGGAALDEVRAIAIHPTSGEVYVTGHTRSADFPKTAGSEQPEIASDGDAFVTRLNAALTSRLQSTFVGGDGVDGAWAIAIHPITGDVYIAGDTNSTNFPKTEGSEHPEPMGGIDAFVTRLNAALTVRLQSTYLGGGSSEQANALAIHPATGEVYTAGYTGSSNFFKVAGAEQEEIGGGGFDAFVARFDSSLATTLQSTYLGASGQDLAFAMAIHPATGEVYVAGRTDSANDFPKVAGAEQTSSGGGNDAFVTRLNPALTMRHQSTYLGGSANDEAGGIAIHPVTGDVYVAGGTTSPDFPAVTGGAQAMYAGGLRGDLFVTRLSAELTTRIQSTYLGTDVSEVAIWGPIAIHPASGQIYVAGSTTSTAFPKVTGSEQAELSGFSDAFVSRFSFDLLATDVVPEPFSFPPKLNVPVGSSQVSDSALITGIDSSVPIAVAGGNHARYCISSTNSCACDVLGFTPDPATINNNQYVCVRQLAPYTTPGVSVAQIHAGSTTSQFLVTTGTVVSQCSLDIDGNGVFTPLTDGLLILRALFGLTGTSVTNGVVGSGATRQTWDQIQPFLNGNCGTKFAP